jgi:hypothetical protein
LRQLHDISASGYEASIVVKELDSTVEDRLMYWLNSGLKAVWLDQQRVQHEHTLSDVAQAVESTTRQPASTVEGDLALTIVELAKVERALKTSSDVMDDTELRDTYASKARLLKRRAELENAQGQAERFQRQQASAKDDITLNQRH